MNIFGKYGITSTNFNIDNQEIFSSTKSKLVAMLEHEESKEAENSENTSEHDSEKKTTKFQKLNLSCFTRAIQTINDEKVRFVTSNFEISND